MPPKQASTGTMALNETDITFLAAVFGNMEKPSIDYHAVAASVGYASDKVAYNKWRAIAAKMGWFQDHGSSNATKSKNSGPTVTAAGKAGVTKKKPVTGAKKGPKTKSATVQEKPVAKAKGKTTKAKENNKEEEAHEQDDEEDSSELSDA